MTLAANVIVEKGRALAQALRDEREFGLLTTIAEALTKGGYDDPKIVRLYAQGLIDGGQSEQAEQGGGKAVHVRSLPRGTPR